jgi:hypothetical protein
MDEASGLKETYARKIFNHSNSKSIPVDVIKEVAFLKRMPYTQKPILYLIHKTLSTN